MWGAALVWALAWGWAGCGPVQHADGPASAAPASAAPAQHVIVVSVDGLMPGTYLDPDAHGLQVPTLRALAAASAFSAGVESVFPSVTYPAHTTMATGVSPAEHGITSNRVFDPLGKNHEGWYWYAEDIRVPTLWQVARAAGKRTALVNWPVTVGADADALVPEYWRAGTPDDVKLVRALSTPGLLDRVAERFPGFWEHFTPTDMQDRASMDIAIHLLETAPPALMLIHIWMVDEHQHRDGPWSDAARQRIEEADSQLGRLIDAARAAGIWERTTLVVVSDHGFAPVTRRVRPGVILRQLGLVTPGEKDTLSAWRAAVVTNGGMAYVYVKDEADEAARVALVEAFEGLTRGDDPLLARVYGREEIRARGGDAQAFLALEGALGVAFSGGYAGDSPSVPISSKGHHGYAPDRPEMKASLLIHGPGIAPGPIAEARLIDLAPSVAAWLGLRLPDARGRVLVPAAP